MGQASLGPLLSGFRVQTIAKNGQQSRHCASGRCGRQQIRHRAAPAVQPPHQHQIDLAAALASSSFSRASRLAVRSSPTADLQQRSSSRAGRHTPAWLVVASEESADQWSKWRAYRPAARNISVAYASLAKNCYRISPLGGPFGGHLERCSRPAAHDPFRPEQRFIIFMQLLAPPTGPRYRGSSRASTPTGSVSTPQRAAAVP